MEQAGIASQGCFAHERCKFQDVSNVTKKEEVASKALEVIGKLYDIEAQKYSYPPINLKTQEIQPSFQIWWGCFDVYPSLITRACKI